jgi:hypothetical protein
LNRVTASAPDGRLCGLKYLIPVFWSVSRCFAIGHSNRDTFTMLLKNGLTCFPNRFPWHAGRTPQLLIDHAQYGLSGYPRLGPADT